MLKEIHAPHLGRTVKLGRKRPVARGPRLMLHNYLDMAKLVPAPDCNYTAPALTGLRDVLLNDRLGCCTCSGVGHLLDTVNCNAGNLVRVTDAQVLALYEAACNYNPADPSSDQGGDEFTVLDYMAEHGLDGKGLHQIVGSVLIDGTNKEEVRWAMWSAGNLYFGEEMPDGYVDLMPQADGFTWGDEGDPDPENGHCFVGAGSNKDGILIDTWGLIGVQTYDAIAKYTAKKSYGELHVVLTREWLSSVSQKTPSGFAYNDLASDLAKIGAIAA